MLIRASLKEEKREKWKNDRDRIIY